MVILITALLVNGCFNLNDPWMGGFWDSAAATEGWLRDGGLGDVSRTRTFRKISSMLGSGVAGLLIYVKIMIII